MSTPERDRYGSLLEAHAVRDLDRGEEQRLRSLAAADRERSAELAAFDALHDRLDAERALRDAVGAPPTPAEEADPGFARLRAVAAGAERQLRARIAFDRADGRSPAGREPSRSEAPVGPSRWHRPAWIAAAACAVAAVALAFALLGRGDGGRPELSGGTPDGRVLGNGARIVLRAEIDPARPVLSWHPIVGASQYDAVIEDRDGRAVLQRTAERAGSTTWELTTDEMQGLRRARGAAGAELLLRIVARDGAGIAIASSGDLPLRLRD